MSPEQLLAERVNDHIEFSDPRVDDGPTVIASLDEWGAFLLALQEDKPTQGAVRTRIDDTGVVSIWHVHGKDAPVTLAAPDWAEFVALVKQGEYDIERLPRQAAQSA
ncbi:hypothetical protein ACIA8R_43850 [Nonomuraea sp. NPDC051191]|uniref:hypothetical protein n=1 Tax=Nonomuraea sp. NPDC051191 TaxID=3364372 RepID=UPI0037A031A9